MTPGEPPAAEGTGHSTGVRTYKARRSRVTPGQRAALERHWGGWGRPLADVPGDLTTWFGRAAPVLLEIGPGMGEATVETAAARRDVDVLAVDVHTPGFGAMLRDAEALGLTNLRVVEGDALRLLERLGSGSLAEVRLLFPDPWPKARHHKRRFVTADSLRLVASRLAPGGVLHVATDWPPYAEVIEELLAASPLTVVARGERLRDRPETRFERTGRREGRRAHDLVAVRA